mmetsp:Transcript_19787/g.34056  ORF Transcript_19787/g.34056 Transcript_19787/m.34056 type:complete len:238 (-) Transcript_19787:1195-1908(-)
MQTYVSGAITAHSSSSAVFAPLYDSDVQIAACRLGSRAPVPSTNSQFYSSGSSSFRGTRSLRVVYADRSFESTHLIVCKQDDRVSKREARKEKLKETLVAVPPSPKETTVYELRPHWSELIGASFAAVSIIGLPLLVGALSRQAWVRYIITDRRITVTGGFRGQDRFDVSYPMITKVVYVKKSLGACADVVMTVKGGGKVEMRAVPDFDEVFKYIMSKVPEGVIADSGLLTAANAPR